MAPLDHHTRDYPDELRTRRLLIRRWRPGDAEALNDEVSRSREHLLPWMPWAALPPMTRAQRVEWIERTNADDPGAVYGIFLPDGATVVGGTGLHDRNLPDELEIGYWIAADRTRRGYATEVTQVLTDVALSLPGVRRVLVKHDVANVTSGRIPERLGYVRIGEYEREAQAPAESGILRVWARSREPSA